MKAWRKKLQPCLADCRFREMFLFSEIWISESFFQCLGSRNLVSEKKRALSVSGICYWWTDIFYFSTFQTILKLSGADSPVSDNSNILSDLQTHTQCTAVRDRTRCAHCYICHRDFNAGVGRNQRFKGVWWCISIIQSICTWMWYKMWHFIYDVIFVTFLWRNDFNVVFCWQKPKV